LICLVLHPQCSAMYGFIILWSLVRSQHGLPKESTSPTRGRPPRRSFRATRARLVAGRVDADRRHFDRRLPGRLRGRHDEELAWKGPRRRALTRRRRGSRRSNSGRRRVARDGKATTKSFREREVPTICVDTACYPASLVSPGRSASEDGRASATSIPLVGPIMAGKPVVVTPAELRHADFEPQLPAP